MTLPPSDERSGRVERIIEVLRVLGRERRITKTHLDALLGVISQSSFKRIKAELTRAGLPLTYDRSDGQFHLPVSASVARYGIDARTRGELKQVRTAVAALGGAAYDALEHVLAVLEARIALDEPQALAFVTSRHPLPRAGADFWAGGERDARTVAPFAVHAHAWEAAQ